MALSASRMIMYLLGAALVVVAVVMFFFAGGLDRWVPVSMLIAGILLILGLSVMGFADNSPSDRPPVRERVVDERDRDTDVTIVKR